MKILEIIPDLSSGGAQRFVVDLCNEFSKHKHIEVILVSFYEIKKEHFFAAELNKSVKVYQLHKKAGFDYRMILKLYKIIKKEEPDIIHSHLSAVKYLIPLALFSKRKYFYTIHTNPNREPYGRVIRIILKYYYDTKRIIPITISRDSSESFKAIYKNNSNVEIINGRPIVKKSEKFNEIKKKIDALKLTPTTQVFVHIARISEEKNQLLLVNVFNKLISDGKDIILIMIGSHNDATIAKQIKTIKHERIFLTGSINNPVDYLYLADAFCLTSFYEGMPITLIEAFQTGCIPVCTPSGGIKNVIKNNENGLLSDDISEVSFEKTVKYFLSLSNSSLIKLKKNSVNSFHNTFHIRITSNSYLNLFKMRNR